MLNKVSGTAVQAIRLEFDHMHETAGKIASASELSSIKPVSETTRSLLDLSQHRRQVAVNAKVIKTSGEMLGTLLDIKA